MTSLSSDLVVVSMIVFNDRVYTKDKFFSLQQRQKQKEWKKNMVMKNKKKKTKNGKEQNIWVCTIPRLI